MERKRHVVTPCLPRGLGVHGASDLTAREAMLTTIRAVYERYGFEPVETPIIEYAEMLGKFLPDQERPNEGVFSFRDDDGQWLSLRYDLTAPLARHVAECFDSLPKPYRTYRTGYVFRNEKPGPGRFRQFMQFDADTVGAACPAADAEICMMAADCMEALGIGRGDYLIRINNRKLLDGVMRTVGLCGEENRERRAAVLRAVDKLDRLGSDAVRLLLGPGRKDESGDFTRGIGLDEKQIDHILELTRIRASDNATILDDLKRFVTEDVGAQGVAELEEIERLLIAAGFGRDRVIIDPSVVRGLEYYTGFVCEAELLFETVNEKGEKARFGSVGGGGRYDGLIGRFREENLPAVGFSIGVSRLQAALSALGRGAALPEAPGPVIVMVMDRDWMPAYQKMVQDLRAASVRAELYLGAGGLRAQMKYADRRGAPLVVIQGADERAEGQVVIKDLIAGAHAAQSIADNRTWRESRPAQRAVDGKSLVDEVLRLLAAQSAERREP